jgi:hypothetical protein
MQLNPSGSSPIINIKFDANIPAAKAESGTCTVFIKKPNTIDWMAIATVVNRPFSSHNIVLDPLIFLEPGSSINDLKNTEIRYNVLFLDIDGDNSIVCSFDLEVTQDKNILVKNTEAAADPTAEFIFFSQTFTLI